MPYKELSVMLPQLYFLIVTPVIQISKEMNISFNLEQKLFSTVVVRKHILTDVTYHLYLFPGLLILSAVINNV